MDLGGCIAEIMESPASSPGALSPADRRICVELVYVSGRDFPRALSSHYTQGKAIKLISGTKSLLQLETNSLPL